MIKIKEYKKLVSKNKYEEDPLIIFHDTPQLKDFLNFKELTLDVKIHLCTMLIKRSVGIKGGIYLPADTDWLIYNFIENYKVDLADPIRTNTHKRAMEMIMGDDVFTDGIIATGYMYTAIEFYLKFKLGYKPHPLNHDDIIQNIRFKEMSIGSAYAKARKSNFRISRELNSIDKYFKDKAVQLGYNINELIQLQGRLNNHRNRFLHGHDQYASSEGTLLVLLFILFHYCEMEETQK